MVNCFREVLEMNIYSSHHEDFDHKKLERFKKNRTLGGECSRDTHTLRMSRIWAEIGAVEPADALRTIELEVLELI